MEFPEFLRPRDGTDDPVLHPLRDPVIILFHIRARRLRKRLPRHPAELHDIRPVRRLGRRAFKTVPEQTPHFQIDILLFRLPAQQMPLPSLYAKSLYKCYMYYSYYNIL